MLRWTEDLGPMYTLKVLWWRVVIVSDPGALGGPWCGAVRRAGRGRYRLGARDATRAGRGRDGAGIQQG